VYILGGSTEVKEKATGFAEVSHISNGDMIVCIESMTLILKIYLSNKNIIFFQIVRFIEVTWG
jgi:hypothetical protein